MAKARDLSFDFLKGSLILLVIIGHVLPGSADSGIRGAIYFFHMPLFLGVTGYFVRRKFLDGGLVNILKKYQWRMIMPYLLAFSAYSLYALFTAWQGEGVSIKTVLGLILYPYYHLWYIPAVIIFVIYTLIAYRNNTLLTLVLVLSSLLAIGWYCYADLLEAKYGMLKFIGDKRFYYYYAFFLLGYLMADRSLSLSGWLTLPLVVLAGGLSYYLADATLADATAWFVFNVALLFLLVGWCKHINMQSENLIVKMGQVSLPIYLWHVMPIIIMGMVFDANSPQFYIATVTLIALLIGVFIKLRGKSHFFDSYFYGERLNWKSKLQ
jgi:fucose 4-O-acetylase-like acetyltransferase